jgi:hypothetical protein
MHGAELQAAEEWLATLEREEWPRGRAIASRQAAVLRRIISESRQAEAAYLSLAHIGG